MEFREGATVDADEQTMGARIRARRLQLGLRLKDVAKRTGLTKSFLSQVERGSNSPSIATLRSLAEALEVPMLYFFLYEERTQIVVRAGERRTITHPGSEMVVELLAPDLQHTIEMVLVHLPPGHDSAAAGTTHRGDECFILIAGSAELDLGTETVQLEAGDSAYIVASHHHLVRNTGEGDAIFISALTPPSF